jgi:hypothetical protein
MDVPSITERLIEAGTIDDFARLSKILPGRNAYYTYLTQLCASHIHPTERPSPYAYDAYYAIADEMEQPQLVGFIKMVTIAENTYAHSGSVSPVIWLFRKAVEKDGFHYHMSGNMYGVSLLAKDFQRCPGTQSEMLADWILSNATNPYLPFGTQTVHSKNIRDLHMEAADWAKRAEEYGKRKAEEDAAAKARRLERAENHKRTLAEQAKLKAQCDQLLDELKRLPIAEMITKIIQDYEHPVFFYESMLTSLAVADVIALPSTQRAALINHLEPINHGKLHRFRERIIKEISEQCVAPYVAQGAPSGER